MLRYFFALLFFLHIFVLPANTQELKLSVDNEQFISLSRYFVNAMPGSSIMLTIEIPRIDDLVINTNYGEIKDKGNGTWELFVPEKPGNYTVEIKDRTTDEQIMLSVFVLTPLSKSKGEYLNGYRIGNYPDEDYKGKNNYAKPKGLIEVTEKNKDLYITPHFQLKQFLCKQESEWPKYVLVNPLLLLKLEYLIDELQKNGHDVNTLFIMSGFRTPYYNKAIGNVKYSRHIYGDAADLYVDENLDGVIDDLDSNGKNSMLDAMLLHELLCEVEKNPENEHLVGGIGKYKKNSVHTYFIHVDTRGYKARW